MFILLSFWGFEYLAAIRVSGFMKKQLIMRRAEAANQTMRFETLDALRGITVILAMVDHVKVQFVSDVHVLIPLTRLSTPGFVILFGVMIEIAYLSKLRAGRTLRSVRERMAARLITCWSLATLLSLAAFASGNLDFDTAWRAALGLELGRFNEILLIYAAFFAFLIAILPLVLRYGSVLILAIALFGWLLQPIFAAAFPEPPLFVNMVLGVGTGYGPALLPAMTFLGFGLALGEALNGRRSYLLVGVMAFIALLVCGSELSHGVMEAGRRFLANRWINHPGYYAVGILGFIGMFVCLLLASRIDRLAGLLNALAKIGSQSLFVYGVGNLWLNLLPMVDMPRALGVCVAFLFLACLISLALAGPAKRNVMGMGLPALWGEQYGKLRDLMARRLVPA